MSVMRFPAHERQGDGPRRFHPRRGRVLTLACIHGPWRPSGAVAAAGVFAVCWTNYSGSWWAALHDFDVPSQLRLIEACRANDVAQVGR